MRRVLSRGIERRLPRQPEDSCATVPSRFQDSDEARSHRIRPRRLPCTGDTRFLAGRVPAVLHGTGLEPRPCAGGRCDPGTGQTHRHPGVARHGAGGSDRLWPPGVWAAWLRQPNAWPLPRSAEQGPLGFARCRAQTAQRFGTFTCRERNARAASSAGRAVARWRGRDRDRRYHRAAVGCEDQGARYLSRSGALVGRSFRQNQRSALVIVGRGTADSLRETAMGAAISDRSGAIGPMERGARQAAQNPDRSSPPGHIAKQTLAGRPPRGGRRRQQLRRFGFDCRRPPPCLPDHAVAAGPRFGPFARSRDETRSSMPVCSNRHPNAARTRRVGPG